MNGGVLTVQVKPIDAPFGPSYDLECADDAMTEAAVQNKSLEVRVEHVRVTSDGKSSVDKLIRQINVNITSAEPTVIQLNQVIIL